MDSVPSEKELPDSEHVSPSQSSQDETDAPPQPANRTLTAEDLKKEYGVAAMMLAADYASKKCDIHENCDGTCSNTIYYTGTPLIDRATLLGAIMMPLASKNPTRATDEDVPRDLEWAHAQELANYQYSPVDSAGEEIRVLRVKKALFRADIVECEIVTLALGQGSEYDALSYCWGSHQMSEVMICDGKLRFITPSLSAALKAYRESMSEASLLWVDAVSIDQNDHEEMSHQIPLMRKIYSEAAEVFVHLGHAEPDTSLGLDLMRRLAITYLHVSEPEKVGAIDLEQAELPADVDVWIEYFKIFASPWFRRTWVLQEIALSRKALLSLGRFVVPWVALEHSLAMIEHAKLLQMAIAPRIPGVFEGVSGLGKMCQIRRLTQSPDANSLIQVLEATRNFKVSDPRDKIIAVLGLTGDLTPELKAMSDYRLTVAQIYHRAAIHLIQTGHSTEVLEHAGLQRQAQWPGLPSWAPDWFTEARENNEPPLSIFRPEPFSAGGFRRVCWVSEGQDDPYTPELKTLGLCHHTIVAVSHLDESSQIRMTATKLAPVYMAWYRYAEQCWRSADNLIYEDREEAFARTLLVNDLYSGGNKVDRATTITDVVAVFRSAIQALEEVVQSEDPERSYDRLMNVQHMDQVSTFLMQMNAAMRGRRLAVTDTGYLGLVPACTQVGDRMAILFGFRTPFVIRLMGEIETLEIETPPIPHLNKIYQARAQLVGDAYMHGVMEGETLEEVGQTLRIPCGIILS